MSMLVYALGAAAWVWLGFMLGSMRASRMLKTRAVQAKIAADEHRLAADMISREAASPLPLPAASVRQYHLNLSLREQELAVRDELVALERRVMELGVRRGR